jgi:transcriptional regulator with XRE-family HTH domain
MSDNESPEKKSNALKAAKGKGLPDPEDAIGRRIRERREERALNVSQLSEHTKNISSDGKGLSRAVIAGYENGEYKPGTRELRILCDALEVSPNWLVFGKESVSERNIATNRILDSSQPELSIARLMYIITSLPEAEFEAVATLLVSLAQKDKALKQALSDDVEVIGRMIHASTTLEVLSPQWAKYVEKLFNKPKKR